MLLKQNLATNIMNGDHRSCMKAVNLHTSLVQDFFTLRTEYWLDTVGRKLLNITHYWGAFEFASGRGQIHTHMLAITGHQVEVLKKYYRLRNHDVHYEKRNKLVSQYARDVLELTADHPGYNNEFEYVSSDLDRSNFTHALKSHYIETTTDKEDQNKLCHSFQIHYCNSFCMRHRRKQTK